MAYAFRNRMNAAASSRAPYRSIISLFPHSASVACGISFVRATRSRASITDVRTLATSLSPATTRRIPVRLPIAPTYITSRRKSRRYVPRQCLSVCATDDVIDPSAYGSLIRRSNVVTHERLKQPFRDTESPLLIPDTPPSIPFTPSLRNLRKRWRASCPCSARNHHMSAPP